MIAVRFANGNTITYNKAVGTRDYGYSIALVDSNGYWVAQVPKGANCIIEGVSPCRIENELEDLTEKNAIKIVARKLKSYTNGSSEYVAILKRKLRDFDLRTGEWKR